MHPFNARLTALAQLLPGGLTAAATATSLSPCGGAGDSAVPGMHPFHSHLTTFAHLLTGGLTTAATRTAGTGGHLAIITSTVSSFGCCASSSGSTSGTAAAGTSGVAWATCSSGLWNFTLTIRLTPCSCMVTP